MTDKHNPWEGMAASQQRRAVADSPHNLFWITDIEGNYGFMLEIKQGLLDLKAPTDIKKIKVIKASSSKDSGKFIMLLVNKEDWQIFYALCCDLISVIYKFEDDLEMVNAAEQRLKKWQQLLSPNHENKMPINKQMGLFSELICMRDIIIPKYGVKQAINSWTGPDFDQQDFLLDKVVIEVKSYKTSRGPTIKISSTGQLISDKIPLFLVTYGLTPAHSGETIADIVSSIELLLEKEKQNIQYIFTNKLIDYGYMPSLDQDSLSNFIIDKNRAFLVSKEFPKVLPQDIKHGVIKVKYSVDLLECLEHEKDIKEVIV